MNPLRVLIVDDEESIRLLVEEWLRREGYETALAANGAQAIAMLRASIFDVLLTDIHLPDMTGIEVLESRQGSDGDCDAVIMTGYPQVETAIQALRLGAYDYLVKPIERLTVQHLFKRIVERRYLREEVVSLRTRLRESPPIDELVGASAAVQSIRETIAKVAPTDSVVLIEGESGTGKEVIAGAIHRMSRRNGMPFVPVNCSAIPADLMESELFGHVKGAFSSASGDSKGLFRSAEGGTLFLDEIGDLPLAMQPKLLRVLQESEVRAVGDTRVHKIDVRIVAATNHQLDAEVRAGRFRQDLFYRLNIVRIEPPPLRTIKADIPLLVMHAVRKLNRRFGRHLQTVHPSAMAALCAYDFPGNVRELENLIERAYALGADGELHASDLPPLVERQQPGMPSAAVSPQTLEGLERELIAAALQQHGNDKAKAADALGLSERTLYRRLKKLGL